MAQGETNRLMEQSRKFRNCLMNIWTTWFMTKLTLQRSGRKGDLFNKCCWVSWMFRLKKKKKKDTDQWEIHSNEI